MKKIVSFILVLLFVLGLTACTDDSTTRVTSVIEENYYNLDLSEYIWHGVFNQEGLMWVKKSDYKGISYGCINTEGEFVIPLTSNITEVNDFKNGLAVVRLKGYYGIYDINGQILKKCKYYPSTKYKQFSNGNVFLKLFQ